MKTLTVTHGPKLNPLTVTVELPGELDNARLTPAMARRAARVACGHCNGVRVMDGDTGYIVYSERRNSHRKIARDIIEDAKRRDERRLLQICETCANVNEINVGEIFKTFGVCPLCEQRKTLHDVIEKGELK